MSDDPSQEYYSPERQDVYRDLAMEANRLCKDYANLVVDMQKDLFFLLEQLRMMEWAQDEDAIKAIKLKYGFKNDN